MTKLICILAILVLNPIFAKNEQEEITISATESSAGKACNVAFGMYRRQLAKTCKKNKAKIDYDKLVVSKCIQKKLAPGKYKGTYNIKFQCKI